MKTEEILRTVQDLVDLAPRATGTEGGERAAHYVADRFRSAGLSKVEFLEVPSWAWRASRCRLSVAETSFECSPILHSALPSFDACGVLHDGTIRTRVVDIGSGGVGENDVKGAVVLFDLKFLMSNAHLLPFTEYVHDPERDIFNREALTARNPYITSLTRVMAQAQAGGAVAVIGVLAGYPESHRYHNELYRRTLMKLPGVWVTQATGARLRQELRQAPTQQVALDLRIERDRVVSRTVLGCLPGRSRETVMVQSHHDSVGPGAVEDATGTAEVIALAEHFGQRAAIEGPREKTLLFVTFDTHFTGYQAHIEFVRDWVLEPVHDLEIVLNVTIEHVGLRAIRGPEGGFDTTGRTEPRGIFENLNPLLKLKLAQGIRRHRLHATTLLNASFLEWGNTGIPTDASFMLLSGVPVVSLISGPLYLYDDADTMEMVDVAQLLPVAEFFADFIDTVDARRGDRIGLIPARIRRRLPRGKW